MMNSNTILIILFVVIEVNFVLTKILNVPLSETLFIIVCILLFLAIVFIHGWKTLGSWDVITFFLIAN